MGYKRYEGANADFILTEEEIPKYNGYVDALNKGIEELNEYNAELRAKGMSELDMDVYKFSDEKYKNMFKEHWDLYNKYITMQEEAMIRTREQKEEGLDR